MNTFATRILLVFGLTILVVSCGINEASNTVTSIEDRVVRAQGEARYPFETLSEMHSFADAWMLVTVEDEVMGPVEGGIPTEGYASSTLTLRVISREWARPGLLGRLPVQSFTMSGTGFAVHDGKAAPLVVDGAERAKVGETYLVGVVIERDGSVTLPAPNAFIRVVDSRVAPPPFGGARPALDALHGLTPTMAVKKVLEAAPAVSDDIETLDARLNEFILLPQAGG